MHLSEVIREWLGWCPNRHLQERKRHADVAGMCDPLSPDRQLPPDNGVPPVAGSERYRSTQFSVFFTAGMIVVVITGIYDSLTYHMFIPGILFALLVISAWLVSGVLTVTIYDNLVEIRLGPVGLKRKICFTEIESVSTEKKMKTRAITYFIVRAIPGKRTWVIIALRDGKRIRIGTDEPEVLKQVLEDGIARAANVRLGSVPG